MAKSRLTDDQETTLQRVRDGIAYNLRYPWEARLAKELYASGLTEEEIVKEMKKWDLPDPVRTKFHNLFRDFKNGIL